MSEGFRRGTVWVRDEIAGIIEETDTGYTFTYSPAYVSKPDTRAVSLTLPIRETPYESGVLFPFFDGLIPEGWLLDLVKKNWKIDKNDRFALLLCACRDCIGDVRIEGTVTE